MEDNVVVIALAGNPNVGKSTIFNGMTGLRQQTGNWAGVTVASAHGSFEIDGQKYMLVDLPGTYSLNSNSIEETVAKDFISSSLADEILLVCDATCLERGLHLLKQTTQLEQIKESGKPVILCINLCDEASKKGIEIDFELLEDVLHIPVISCCARNPDSLLKLKKLLHTSRRTKCHYDCLDFSPKLLAQETVVYTKANYRSLEEQMDQLVTGPFSGSLIMLLLFMGIFWLSMTGANYPSQLLWKLLFSMEGRLQSLLIWLGAPNILIDALVFGMYRVLAWVISVMLPPMAIFFPLFTLLEDFGYLPRVAFNMDSAFEKCKTCGKQCLTMAMGLGCNAAGVIGCRIIDSPRERLMAIVTNSMIPCNGRLPTLFTLISLFFLANAGYGLKASILSSLLLTGFLALGMVGALGSCWLLSHTLLKGVPSAFTLELPPYRRPQFRRVLVRSVLDRTLFVLGRAVAAAAPAGLIIWFLANISFSGQSLLAWFTGALDPLGRLMGLDGAILSAFLLGFPANEIVLPLILMTYLQTGRLMEMGDSNTLFQLLSSHGWTWQTACSMCLFCLFHWPCSTTCLTIKKETGSWSWTAMAIALPTLLGVSLCILLTAMFRFFLP